MRGWFALSLSTMLALLCSGAARAQIYKCAGSSTPVYQDTPCATGQELRNFTADPAQVSVLPMPPLPAASTATTGHSRAARAAAAAEARSASRAGRARGGGGGDPSQRRYLFAGMQAGEVLARAGPPDMKAGGGKSARWTYLPHPLDSQTLTTVVIEDGRVVDVERKMVR